MQRDTDKNDNEAEWCKVKLSKKNACILGGRLSKQEKTLVDGQAVGLPTTLWQVHVLSQLDLLFVLTRVSRVCKFFYATCTDPAFLHLHLCYTFPMLRPKIPSLSLWTGCRLRWITETYWVGQRQKLLSLLSRDDIQQIEEGAPVTGIPCFVKSVVSAAECNTTSKKRCNQTTMVLFNQLQITVSSCQKLSQKDAWTGKFTIKHRNRNYPWILLLNDGWQRLHLYDDWNIVLLILTIMAREKWEDDEPVIELPKDADKIFGLGEIQPTSQVEKCLFLMCEDAVLNRCDSLEEVVLENLLRDRNDPVFQRRFVAWGDRRSCSKLEAMDEEAVLNAAFSPNLFSET